MKTVSRFAAVVAVLLSLMVIPGHAADTLAAPKLEPNAVLHFQFPELPAPFLSKKTDSKAPAQISAQLPANYTATGKFPLFVFLEGGTGEAGDNPAKARAIIGNNDFIAVTLPIFKVDIADPKKPYVGLEDYADIGPAYTKMLQKLLDTVPNIDPSRSAICGFSNGGHSIADILIKQDPFFMKLFPSFVLVEGGTPFKDHPEILTTLAASHTRLLIMIGEHPKEEAQIEQFKSLLTAMGLDITYVSMQGTGHAFPEKYYPTVSSWVNGKAPVLP